MSGTLVSSVTQNLRDSSDLEKLLYQHFQRVNMDATVQRDQQTAMINILAGKLPVSAGCSRGTMDPPSSSQIAQHKTVYSSSSLLAMKVLLSRENIALDSQMDDRDSNGNISSSGRYKTELCRPFEESGQCKYGDKCQFAHGAKELRSLPRHPKYKTDLCRTYHTIGFCPYGPRCHFIHNEDERRLGSIINNKNQQNNKPHHPTPIHRPKWSNLQRLSSMGSSLDSPRSSDSGSPTRLSPTFSEDIFSSSSVPFSILGSDGGSSRSSPDFTTSCHANNLTSQKSLTTPLNVQTHLNTVDTVLDLLRMQQQFNRVLSFTDHNSNQQRVADDNCVFRNIYPCASYSSPESATSSHNSTHDTPSSTFSVNWIHQ
ncbi:mRNA decay activator protein ZFP36L2-like [Gigantopelta aegis]|uniref:mRNA decay activator protein ZFP36L2-like n=1 Tax=Gigantopelta aegis TaxID=1735272 RepID=UPI001B88B86B|nr:mRNA decay activator protein ZFP36L2-like [Gigantopelta aegis]